MGYHLAQKLNKNLKKGYRVYQLTLPLPPPWTLFTINLVIVILKKCIRKYSATITNSMSYFQAQSFYMLMVLTNYLIRNTSICSTSSIQWNCHSVRIIQVYATKCLNCTLALASLNHGNIIVMYHTSNQAEMYSRTKLLYCCFVFNSVRYRGLTMYQSLSLRP